PLAGINLKMLRMALVRDRRQQLFAKLREAEKVIVLGLDFRRDAVVRAQAADQFVVGIKALALDAILPLIAGLEDDAFIPEELEERLDGPQMDGRGRADEGVVGNAQELP